MPENERPSGAPRTCYPQLHDSVIDVHTAFTLPDLRTPPTVGAHRLSTPHVNVLSSWGRPHPRWTTSVTAVRDGDGGGLVAELDPAALADSPLAWLAHYTPDLALTPAPDTPALALAPHEWRPDTRAATGAGARATNWTVRIYHFTDRDPVHGRPAAFPDPGDSLSLPLTPDWIEAAYHWSSLPGNRTWQPVQITLTGVQHDDHDDHGTRGRQPLQGTLNLDPDAAPDWARRWALDNTPALRLTRTTGT